jgi:hypothetical protein
MKEKELWHCQDIINFRATEEKLLNEGIFWRHTSANNSQKKISRTYPSTLAENMGKSVVN